MVWLFMVNIVYLCLNVCIYNNFLYVLLLDCLEFFLLKYSILLEREIIKWLYD